jgi:hypothetical protein
MPIFKVMGAALLAIILLVGMVVLLLLVTAPGATAQMAPSSRAPS